MRKMISGPGAKFGGAVATAILVGSLGGAIPMSGASTVKESAPSAFCSTLISLAKVSAPTATNFNNYKKWIAVYLPYYQKLATEAPVSARPVLSGLVTLMQNEGATVSAQSLGSYVAAHSKQWANGWKAFVTAAISCAKSVYG